MHISRIIYLCISEDRHLEREEDHTISIKAEIENGLKEGDMIAVFKIKNHRLNQKYYYTRDELNLLKLLTGFIVPVFGLLLKSAVDIFKVAQRGSEDERYD